MGRCDANNVGGLDGGDAYSVFAASILERAGTDVGHDLARVGGGSALTPVRNAEVSDQGASRARLEQDVVGLHVAVDDAASMCVAISLKGACSVVAANASAQLLDLDGLAMAQW